MKYVAAALVSLAVVHFNSARTLHVGSGRAYPNLQPAASVAVPGDTILLHGGTYSGGQYITNLKGSAQAWISLRAADDGPVIFDGSGQAIHLVDPAYVEIRGITFRRQTLNGVNVDDGGTYSSPAKHVVFDSCTWEDLNATGNNDQLKMSGVDSFVVRNCRFINGSPGGSGVDMVGCHWGLFSGNRFENQGSNCIQAKGGTRHITIERNLFKKGGDRALNLGGSTGLEFFRPLDAPFEAADLFVYSNIFVGSNAPIAYVGCTNVHVINNTIYDPQRWVIRILQETVDPNRFVPCGNSSFRNNIVVLATTLSTECNVGSNTAPQTFRFSNNVWFYSSSVNWSGPRDLPVIDSSGIRGQDPRFFNPTQEDFRIQPHSPAAGRGLRVAEPTLDFGGKPFALDRSSGAYEIAAGTRVELSHTRAIATQRSTRRVVLSCMMRKPEDRYVTVCGRSFPRSAAGLLVKESR